MRDRGLLRLPPWQCLALLWLTGVWLIVGIVVTVEWLVEGIERAVEAL